MSEILSFDEFKECYGDEILKESYSEYLSDKELEK